MFLPLKRATLLVPSGPQNDPLRKHLFILLTDPHEDESGRKCVLMVSLSTVREGQPHDPTCILKASDHPFVRRDSYVLYQKARIEEATKLQRGVKIGMLIPHDPLDGATYERVCAGIESSGLTPARLLQFYRKARTGV